MSEYALDTVHMTVLIPSERRLGDEQDGDGILKSERNTLVWVGTAVNGGPDLVLKMYRNRGPISWQRERHFRFRVQREYDALLHLKQHSIPGAVPTFWTYGSCGKHGHYEILATERIPTTTTFATFLEASSRDTIREHAPDLLRLIRRMHQSGLYHGMLNGRNVLVKQEAVEAPTFHLIDTPQAILFPRDITGTRVARFDLLECFWHLTDRDRIDRDGALHCLHTYGMSEPEADDFMRRLATHHGSKHLRNQLRTEFGARARWERLRHR